MFGKYLTTNLGQVYRIEERVIGGDEHFKSMSYKYIYLGSIDDLSEEEKAKIDAEEKDSGSITIEDDDAELFKKMQSL